MSLPGAYGVTADRSAGTRPKQPPRGSPLKEMIALDSQFDIGHRDYGVDEPPSGQLNASALPDYC